MSNPLTLIDTSAFIEFSRSAEGEVSAAVDAALAQGRAAVCSVVAAELLSGCRTRAEYREMALLLGGLHLLAVTEECWARAGALGFNLRRRGITVPLTDRLVVVTARLYDVALLHCDAHFDLIGDTPDSVR